MLVFCEYDGKHAFLKVNFFQTESIYLFLVNMIAALLILKNDKFFRI